MLDSSAIPTYGASSPTKVDQFVIQAMVVILVQTTQGLTEITPTLTVVHVGGVEVVLQCFAGAVVGGARAGSGLRLVGGGAGS